MKVAILGSATGWREAPFADPDYEIWALNDQYLALEDWQLARVTRWFELHGDTPITRSRRPPDHWQRIDALNIPTYTFHDVPVLATRVFPLKQAVDAGRDYFACTCAYQIALALSEGATAIGMYGICFHGTREALVERPCVEWWLGLAEGRGVDVTIAHPWNYGLGRHLFRYALDDDEERRDTYAVCRQHAEYALSWLIDETKRLNLTPDPMLVEP